MKNFLIALLVSLFVFLQKNTSFAQNISENATVQEWILDKKDKVKFVSRTEYNKLSSSEKSELDRDADILVYNQKVSLEDINLFESKASKLATEKTFSKSDDQRYDSVLKWLEIHKDDNIKIISYQDYSSRPLEERTYIDNLAKKIIYPGNRLAWKDIQIYEQQGE